MGVDWGDYNNDGQLDLAVGTFQHQAKSIYRNDGNTLFTDVSRDLGVSSAAWPYIAFGMKWLDADNDGWLDLMIANGHVRDNAAAVEPGTSYRQPTQLFRNEQGRRFIDVSGAALAGSAGRPIVGRGLAIGDYDNDGKIDALVVDSEGKPLLLHNETPNAGHWLEITLIGTKSNREGQGARITVETGAAGAVKRLRQCSTNGSYLSASDRRVHVGLGASSTAERLSVHWPDGHIDHYANVPADRQLTIHEGAASLQP